MMPALTTDVLAASDIVSAVRLELQRNAHARASAESHEVTTRTTPSVVRFNAAFMLQGFDAPQPPGDYREESLEGASRTAWRRVATFIHLPAISAKGSTQQMVPIEPATLEAALDHDRRQP